LFAIIVGKIACAQFTIANFTPLYSLTGSWKMKTSKGILFEQWQKKNDSTLSNKSFRVNGADTTMLEQVMLNFQNGSVTYYPNLPDQEAVSFKLVEIKDGQYIFENKTHDFPQRIIYKIDKNQLAVSINGNTPKGFKEIPYLFTRE
jgi:hypothetical protein